MRKKNTHNNRQPKRAPLTRTQARLKAAELMQKDPLKHARQVRAVVYAYLAESIRIAGPYYGSTTAQHLTNVNRFDEWINRLELSSSPALAQQYAAAIAEYVKTGTMPAFTQRSETALPPEFSK